MPSEITRAEIEKIMESLFPHGAGQANHIRVAHALEQLATVAFSDGKRHGLSGLMTVPEVAEHFGISDRRARALITNRHKRFAIGKKYNKRTWLIHSDELDILAPDERYQTDND